MKHDRIYMSKLFTDVVSFNDTDSMDYVILRQMDDGWAFEDSDGWPIESLPGTYESPQDAIEDARAYLLGTLST